MPAVACLQLHMIEGQKLALVSDFVLFRLTLCTLHFKRFCFFFFNKDYGFRFLETFVTTQDGKWTYSSSHITRGSLVRQFELLGMFERSLKLFCPIQNIHDNSNDHSNYYDPSKIYFHITYLNFY